MYISHKYNCISLSTLIAVYIYYKFNKKSKNQIFDFDFPTKIVCSLEKFDSSRTDRTTRQNVSARCEVSKRTLHCLLAVVPKFNTGDC